MIEAVLHLQLNHRSGPWIANSDQVLTWLVADGQVPQGTHGGFMFLICSEHAEPDECDHAGDAPTMTSYEATFSYVGRP